MEDNAIPYAYLINQEFLDNKTSTKGYDQDWFGTY